MKAIVIYDSQYGNTEHIARAIAEALDAAPVITAGKASERDLTGIDLLAIGGPTQGHGLSPALHDFLDSLPAEVVSDLRTMTFDTRLDWPRFLSGSAASTAAKQLAKKGARIVAPPESFLVAGKEGPLMGGELERAPAWANEVRAAAGLAEPELVSTGR